MKTIVDNSVVFSPENLIEYAEGGIVSRQLTMTSVGNTTIFAIDKGQKISEHSAPFDAIVQILEGQAEILIGGAPHILNKGEMIIMPADVPHALNAPEKFKMLLVMIKGERK